MKRIAISGLIVLVTVVASGLAQESPGTGFPLDGVITGNVVNVRSGPDTSWYAVSRLAEGTRVQVIGQAYGWYKITPPAGSFSWISKEDVEPAGQAGLVRVRADEAAVRAGSQLPDAADKRASVQTLLGKGTELKVTGDQGGWYKIATPEGAGVWISTDYVKPVPAGEKTQPKPSEQPIAATTQSSTRPSTQPAAKKEAQGPLGTFTEKLRQLDALLIVERRKPLLEQRWSELKSEYQQIAEQTGNVVASQYAQRRLQLIEDQGSLQEGYVKLEHLGNELTRVQESTKRELDELRAKKLEEKPAIWQAEGVLEQSRTFVGSALMPNRLVLYEAARAGQLTKVIAYVELETNSNIPVEKYLGKYVAVSGEVRYDPTLRIDIIRAATIRERHSATQPTTEPSVSQ